jgi:hypothetical protein
MRSVVVALFVAGAAVLAAPPVAAQTGPGAAARSPFPAERVVSVPEPEAPADGPAPTVPPFAAITDVSVSRPAPGVAPDVVVRFAEPFAPPAGYQLSVSVGEPDGPRLRASLVLPTAASAAARSARGGVPVQGVLAGGDGQTWTELGPTAAQLDGLGFAIITLPLASAPPGPLVWVEVFDGTSMTPVRVSPLVSRAALFGEGDPTVVPTPPTGQVHDATGRAAGRQRVGPGPTLTMRDGALVVTYPDGEGAAPGEAAADREVDTLRLAAGYSGSGRRSAEVRIDRRTGDVALYETPTRVAGAAGIDPPAGSTDRSGDRSWVRGGPPARGRPVERLELDLAALSGVLGTELAPAGTAVSLGRTLAFPDRRTVTTDGVYATLASIDQGLTPPTTRVEAPPAPAPPPAPSEAAVPPAALAAGVVVLATVVLVLRRRRRRRRARLAAAAAATAEDRVPWESGDGQLTREAEQERMRIVTAELPVVPEGDDLEAVELALADTGAPVVPDLALGERRRRRGRGARSRPDGAGPRSPEGNDAGGTAAPPAPDPEAADTEAADRESSARETADDDDGRGRMAGPVAADDVLAALDDEAAHVRARLAELGPPDRSS